MTGTGPSDAVKGDLHRYLRAARKAVLWKLDGLSEYDARRPMTPTATNLLGLVKHLAAIEAGYFCLTFDRPFPDAPEWMRRDPGPNEDMWATAEEARDDVVALYRSACAHADRTIEELDLTDTGRVPWWGGDPVPLHTILVHVLAETNRHSGHMDVVRELVDGAAGLLPGNDNMAEGDAAWWAAYREQVEQAARAASGA